MKHGRYPKLFIHSETMFYKNVLTNGPTSTKELPKKLSLLNLRIVELKLKYIMDLLL